MGKSMKNLVKIALFLSITWWIANPLHAAVDAAVTCTNAVNALLSDGKSRTNSPLSSSSGTREIRWSSTGGHQGICVIDDLGRVFEVRVTKFPQQSVTPYTLTCESKRQRRAECPMKGPATVQLERQTGKTRCTQNKNWGVSQNTLWVEKGCKGRFKVTPLPTWDAYTVTCQSKKQKRVSCPIKPNAVIQLHRQLSRASCQQGESWGQGDDVIWVDKNCKAIFSVKPWNSWNPGLHPTRELARQTCARKAREHRFSVKNNRVIETAANHIDVELSATRNNVDLELMCRFDVNNKDAKLYSH